MKKMRELKNILKKDLYRYDGETNFFKGYLIQKGFRYTFYLRIATITKGISYYFSKFILRQLVVKYGYEISEKTEIGEGLAILHLGGIAINKNAILGKNITIFQGVTIGGDVGKRKGAPKIGNKVWIGANAVVVGNITIGDNVLIAANSLVNFNVPDNSLVIGNPAMIKPFYKINEYIEYIYKGK